MESKTKSMNWLAFGASLLAATSLVLIYRRQKSQLPKLTDNESSNNLGDEKSEIGGGARIGHRGGRGGGARGFYPYPAVLPYYYAPETMCEYVDKNGRRLIQQCGVNYKLELPNY